MESNERDRKLEQWLDEALSQYSAAEPRLGLESRVLARIEEEREARRRRWSVWRWMPAFAAVAAVIVVAVAVRPMLQNRAQKPSVASPMTTAVVAPEASAPAATTEKKSRPESTAARNTAPAQRSATRDEIAAVSDVTAEKEQRVQEPASQNAMAVTRSGSGVGGGIGAGVGGGMHPAKTAPAAPSVADADKAAVVKEETPAQSKDGLVIGGVVKNLPRETETIGSGAPVVSAQAPPVAAEAAAAPSGIIGTEKVQLMATPEVKKALARKAATPMTATAKPDAQETQPTMYGLIRTDLKRVPPGPVQQFPTPTPLSEQEKMMLAAGPRLKQKSNGEDKKKTDFSNIEIKDIEIAPLAGPQK